MALKSFGRGASGEFEVSGMGSSSGSSPGSGSLSAFIDQGSEFEGKLSFRDTVRIDGRFRGEIASENTLIVGETGEIHATIRSNTVVVSGLVEGDIQAARKVVLHKTARVLGNIEAATLVVEEGAEIHGQIRMKGEGKGTPLKALPGGGGPGPKDPVAPTLAAGPAASPKI
jgi:cytoskeletal protein CcmA (bactofilin family)